MIRIGHGFDSHRFIEGDCIPIGGILIPCQYAVKAHSDGDVLLHALGDALLGSVALGDMGTHFKDDDPANYQRKSCEHERWI